MVECTSEKLKMNMTELATNRTSRLVEETKLSLAIGLYFKIQTEA